MDARRRSFQLMVVALATVPGSATEPTLPGPEPWLATCQLGASLWPGLRDLAVPPSGFEVVELGGFRTNGGNLEMGLYRARRSSAGRELQVGGEFGVWWHGSGNRTTFTDPTHRITTDARPAVNGGHLTGSVRLAWPGQRVTPFLGLGAGWYMLVLKETYSDMVVDTSVRSSAPGGFLTAGLEVRGVSAFAFRTDAQVHFASFGGSALRGQHVSGPIYTLRIGASLRF